MSYFVTLPSNGADLKTEEDLQNNTQTDFVIKLNRTLNFFQQEYEVGLAEIWFNLNWKVNMGNIAMIHSTLIEINNGVEKFNRIEIFNQDIEWFDGDHISGLIVHLNNLLKTDLLKNNIDSKTNKIIKDFLKTKFRLTHDQKSLLIFTSPSIKIKISGYLRQILRHPESDIDGLQFQGDQINQKDLKKHFDNPIEDENSISLIEDNLFAAKFDFVTDKKSVIEEIFVYSDIIDYQYVASSMSQLLRVVTVNKNQLNLVCNTLYNNPDYLPLIKNRVSSIRLFMRDSMGNPIRFSNPYSRVIYKLHFRQKQKYYK